MTLYHAHDDMNKILVCPECFGTDLENKKNIAGWFLDELYQRGSHKSNDANDQYYDEFGHEPKERQHHFLCTHCDRECRFAIFPYNYLKKFDMRDAQKTIKENPYDSIFD